MVDSSRYRFAAMQGMLLVTLMGLVPASMAADGPLRVHPDNPRYFTDGTGQAIYLTGSHTWGNLQDQVTEDARPNLDYADYLDLLAEHNHNFIRLWAWESSTRAPLPYRRTGPGMALDGKPKFDLARWDQAYFDRLKARVSAAEARGIYVAVMLFQGWSVAKKLEDRATPWPRHPFHKDNNVNGIDGDIDGNNEGEEIHTLEQEAVTRLQETYVRKVVDTLNSYANVLYEISNESHKGSHAWQHHMIEFIQHYQADRPYQHPLVMTVAYPGGDNEPLFRSTAEAISPKDTDGAPYQTDPPPADGHKVILIDSDHLWGIGGDRHWVWKSFTRGLHPIYMDPVNTGRGSSSVKRRVPGVRLAMGHTLSYASRMDLAKMDPDRNVSTTGYALVNPGMEYLVYQPRAGVGFRVGLPPGKYDYEFFNAKSGRIESHGQVTAEGPHHFHAPFHSDAVLYLKRSSPDDDQQ